MEEEKEILSKKEQFINMIYLIFRCAMYILGFMYMYLMCGELITLISISAFTFLSVLYHQNKHKIKENNKIKK